MISVSAFRLIRLLASYANKKLLLKLKCLPLSFLLSCKLINDSQITLWCKTLLHILNFGTWTQRQNEFSREFSNGSTQNTFFRILLLLHSLHSKSCKDKTWVGDENLIWDVFSNFLFLNITYSNPWKDRIKLVWLSW